MLIEPGVEVNDVVDQAAAQADRGRPDLCEQRDANPKVFSRLLAGEASGAGQRQGRAIVHGWPSWPALLALLRESARRSKTAVDEYAPALWQRAEVTSP